MPRVISSRDVPSAVQEWGERIPPSISMSSSYTFSSKTRCSGSCLLICERLGKDRLERSEFQLCPVRIVSPIVAHIRCMPTYLRIRRLKYSCLCWGSKTIQGNRDAIKHDGGTSISCKSQGITGSRLETADSSVPATSTCHSTSKPGQLSFPVWV